MTICRSPAPGRMFPDRVAHIRGGAPLLHVPSVLPVVMEQPSPSLPRRREPRSYRDSGFPSSDQERFEDRLCAGKATGESRPSSRRGAAPTGSEQWPREACGRSDQTRNAPINCLRRETSSLSSRLACSVWLAPAAVRSPAWLISTMFWSISCATAVCCSAAAAICWF